MHPNTIKMHTDTRRISMSFILHFEEALALLLVVILLGIALRLILKNRLYERY